MRCPSSGAPQEGLPHSFHVRPQHEKRGIDPFFPKGVQDRLSVPRVWAVVERQPNFLGSDPSVWGYENFHSLVSLQEPRVIKRPRGPSRTWRTKRGPTPERWLDFHRAKSTSADRRRRPIRKTVDAAT